VSSCTRVVVIEYTLGTIPGIDQSRPKVSNAYWSSYRNANFPHIENPMTLCTYKLIDFSLSILMDQTLKTPGVLGLSCLLLSLPYLLCYILISDHRSFPFP
jgi:hypothetical protein